MLCFDISCFIYLCILFYQGKCPGGCPKEWPCTMENADERSDGTYVAKQMCAQCNPGAAASSSSSSSGGEGGGGGGTLSRRNSSRNALPTIKSLIKQQLGSFSTTLTKGSSHRVGTPKLLGSETKGITYFHIASYDEGGLRALQPLQQVMARINKEDRFEELVAGVEFGIAKYDGQLNVLFPLRITQQKKVTNENDTPEILQEDVIMGLVINSTKGKSLIPLYLSKDGSEKLEKGKFVFKTTFGSILETTTTLEKSEFILSNDFTDSELSTHARILDRTYPDIVERAVEAKLKVTEDALAEEKRKNKQLADEKKNHTKAKDDQIKKLQDELKEKISVVEEQKIKLAKWEADHQAWVKERKRLLRSEKGR